VITLYTHYTTN